MMLRPENRMKVKALKQTMDQNVRGQLFNSTNSQIPQIPQQNQAVFLGPNGQPMVMNVNLNNSFNQPNQLPQNPQHLQLNALR